MPPPAGRLCRNTYPISPTRFSAFSCACTPPFMGRMPKPPERPLVPKLMKFLRVFCGETDATLARVLRAKLPPGKSVGWHVDRGSYYQATARYHLAILNEGVTFR